MIKIEKEIFDRIKFHQPDSRAKKYLGALTTEVIKDFLEQEGFNVSQRDVYVKGLSTEIDLLVLKKDAKPIYRCIYDPRDIISAFEIKFRGIFSSGDLDSIRKSFDKIREANNEIKCIYLTVTERKTYKHKATNKNIDGKVFELFKLDKDVPDELKKRTFYEKASGDWNKLVEYLRAK